MRWVSRSLVKTKRSGLRLHPSLLPCNTYWMGLDSYSLLLLVTLTVALKYTLCSCSSQERTVTSIRENDWLSQKSWQTGFFFFLSDCMDVYKKKMISIVLQHVHSEMKLQLGLILFGIERSVIACHLQWEWFAHDWKFPLQLLGFFYLLSCI